MFSGKVRLGILKCWRAVSSLRNAFRRRSIAAPVIALPGKNLNYENAESRSRNPEVPPLL